MGRIGGGGDAAGIINSAIIVWVIAGLSWFWLNYSRILLLCASLDAEGLAEEKKGMFNN